jgi:hypothetical protein
MYDAALGRWHVVDPIAEKYVAWSPYQYVMNNPVKFLDPNGEGAAIPYVDKDGNKQIYLYFGDGNPANSQGPPPDAFSRAVVEAYKSNNANAKKAGNNGGANLRKLIEDPDNIVIIREGDMDKDGGSTDAYFPMSNEIRWDPTAAVLTEEDVLLSPASNLDHEAGHANLRRKILVENNYDITKFMQLLKMPSRKFDNMLEEGQITLGGDEATAVANGEGIPGRPPRGSHRGTFVRVKGPSSHQRVYPSGCIEDILPGNGLPLPGERRIK